MQGVLNPEIPMAFTGPADPCQRILSPKALTEELPYLLALDSLVKLETRLIRVLLPRFDHSAKALWFATPNQLQGFDIPDAALAEWKEKQGLLNPYQLIDLYRNTGIQTLCWSDPNYPPLLREIHDPPMILYLKGNLSALTGRTLAFVGTRRASDYGYQTTEHLIRGLAGTDIRIISGLAQGIDGKAHQMALETELPTAAVFGCGLDTIFPSKHKTLAQQIVDYGGALVSEYPLGTQAHAFHFPRRNRIIAGLSQGVVIVEGNIKSGSLITARLSMEENRTVFAVPGNIFNPAAAGPHELIRTGAVMVTGADDILSEMGWSLTTPRPAKPNLAKFVTETPQAVTPSSEPTVSAKIPNDIPELWQKILAAIPFDPILVETVAQKTALTAPQVSQALTMLELEGYVDTLPGSQVVRRPR